MRVVVIGAGIIGSSVAYRLAQAGADVIALERAHVGAGSSGTSFAWTNANRKPPRAYHDLNVAGMALYRSLNEEFEDTSWFRVTGSIEWATSEADRRSLCERVERLQSWSYSAEWIDRNRLAELEPDVSLDAVGDAQIAFFPDEGLVDPVPYAAAMMGAAIRRHGAKIRIGSSVAEIAIEAGRATAAIMEDGERLEADVFVNCTGRWVNDIVKTQPDLTVPMAPTVGLLVLTPPAPAAIFRPLHCSEVNIRPDGGGRLMLRSNDGDANSTLTEPAGPTSPVARNMMSAAARVIPALYEMKPEATRTTLRSIPADDLSVVGTLPGVENYYVCITHSGVTLAPILGKLVTEDLLEDHPSISLAPFRPARFLASVRDQHQ